MSDERVCGSYAELRMEGHGFLPLGCDRPAGHDGPHGQVAMVMVDGRGQEFEIEWGAEVSDETVRHACEASEDTETGEYGFAVDQCWEEDDGRFWASNGEYANVVDFCPFCGAKAPQK